MFKQIKHSLMVMSWAMRHSREYSFYNFFTWQNGKIQLESFLECCIFMNYQQN